MSASLHHPAQTLDYETAWTRQSHFFCRHECEQRNFYTSVYVSPRASTHESLLGDA